MQDYFGHFAVLNGQYNPSLSLPGLLPLYWPSYKPLASAVRSGCFITPYTTALHLAAQEKLSPEEETAFQEAILAEIAKIDSEEGRS